MRANLPPTIAIAGIGLCTAQGTAAELIAMRRILPATPLPWPSSARATCRIGFAARGIDPALRGAARWHALAAVALAELGDTGEAPILVGSCNAAAAAMDADAWRRAFQELGLAGPIASAACASGMHALWLGATQIAAGCDEVVVLAADILSAVNQDQFEGLRILSELPAPWQPHSTGFVLGEAAVAIRLVRARDGDGLPRLTLPVLAHDRDGIDALRELVATADASTASFVIGQGSGPSAADDRELAALRATVPLATPVATALPAFGHTLGASSLLSVALAVLAQNHDIAGLAPMSLTASDGRPLGAARGNAMVVCRALGGACAVSGVGASLSGWSPARWTASAPPPALRIPLLRELAAAAPSVRPASPPAVLVVQLDAPLAPPEDARLGDRILPSVVLEMTPGFIAQLVARAWGFAGPALCLVGGTAAECLPGIAACRRVHGATFVLHVRNDGFEWEA